MSAVRLVDETARQQAATDLDTTFIVEAAAGTGKTTLLISRILSIVRTGRARLSEVVAITFTEKAAGELKVRLRERIEEELGKLTAPKERVERERFREALRDLERAHISTIHSFCAWLLRERPVEAVVDPQFAVADEVQRTLLLDQAWQQWLAAELTQNPAALRRALMLDVGVEKLQELANLLIDQRTRVEAAHWPAPQSLSLKTIVATIAAAAPRLASGLKHFTARDENAFKSAQTFLDVLPQLARASEDRQLALLAALELTNPRAIAHFDSPGAFREMKDVVTGLKKVLDEVQAAADHNLLLELGQWLQGFVNYFETIKREQALLDFDDLLGKTRDLLRDNRAVRAQLQQRIQFLLVDEFQDTDPLQMQIVFYLAAGKAGAGAWDSVKLAPGKLFIVGDPKQSIYSFRRADIEMYSAAKKAVAKQGQVLAIRQNFRSRSTLLEWVNAVFTPLVQKPGDGDYQPDYVSLEPCDKFRTKTPAVVVLRPETWPDGDAEAIRTAEATVLAKYLRAQQTAGVCQWSDVVFLFRSFTSVGIYTETLLRYGIPARVIGGKDYYTRQEIQTLASLLFCLDNPADKLHLIATLRSALFGWPDELIFLVSETNRLDYLRDPGPLDEVAAGEREQARRSFELLRELHARRHEFSVAGFLEHVFARTKICEAFFVTPDGAQCVANLLKALEMARQFEAAGLRSLTGFVRRLRETVMGGFDEEPSPATEETDNVVRLMSVHKSKGLEFPTVVLPDLTGRSQDSGAKLEIYRASGKLELRFASRKTADFDAACALQKPRETAEEIRLMYVATTRARERLIIPWFRERGERLDLLVPALGAEAGKLVERPDLKELARIKEVEDRPVTVALEGEGNDRDAAGLVNARRAWQSQRAELLERAAQPRPRVTPSKLAKEPEPQEQPEPVGAARGRAMELGIVVHGALEMVDYRNSDAEQRRQAREFVASAGLSDTETARAGEMVENALRSELWGRVRRAEQVWRELPFALVLPGRNDALLEGKLDLLFCENGAWVLVDFKTDSRVDAERYREQMSAYAQALAHVAGIRVAEKLLFYVATGTVVEVN